MTITLPFQPQEEAKLIAIAKVTPFSTFPVVTFECTIGVNRSGLKAMKCRRV